MTRLPDWKPRLIAYLATVARRPYRPGRHDCALFVAGGVAAMTGIDLAAEWRGYASLREGRARLAEAGIEDLAGLAARHFAEVPGLFAQEGDVAVLSDRRGQQALGLVQGPCVYGVGRSGLALAPLTAVERAFRV